MGGSDEGTGLDVTHAETGEKIHTFKTAGACPVVAWAPTRYWLAYRVAGGLRIIGGGLDKMCGYWYGLFFFFFFFSRGNRPRRIWMAGARRFGDGFVLYGKAGYVMWERKACKSHTGQVQGSTDRSTSYLYYY